MVSGFNKKGNGEFFSDKLLFKTFGIIFLVVIVFLAMADYKIYQKKKVLNAEIKNYQKQIEDIKKSSQNLKEEIANSDNVDYLEKLAYEQLGQQKPGEKEVIFVTPQEKQKTAEEPNNFWDSKVWSGWLSGAWQWIKNKF
jgi:cell division protein FtsB